MRYCVFDIEANGLLEEATKIHCLAYQIYEGKNLLEKGVIQEIPAIKSFLEQQEILVGHNIIRYDLPVLAKLADLRIKPESQIIDTLALSYYLYPFEKFKHGLEAWGERLEAKKIQIIDWESLEFEQYQKRCEQDVVINSKLFQLEYSILSRLYDNDSEKINKLVQYLTFKFICLRDQEKVGIHFNRREAEFWKHKLTFQIENQKEELAKSMPKILKERKPVKMYKQDGTLSAVGEKWKTKLRNLGLPEDSDAIYTDGNPSSSQQMKAWLLSIGWQPDIFEESKTTKKKIPQISLKNGEGITESVKALYEKKPVLRNLEGLYIAQHRLSIFESFLKAATQDDKVFSTAHGFTSTMRLQHSNPVVNLPKPDRYLGKEIRGLLTVPDDNWLMCGADISGLEDNTKQHYLYFFDPEYVKEMRTPGFDPHLDIALLANIISKDDVEFYKSFKAEQATSEDKQRYSHIKTLRSKAKQVNFASTYSASPPKIQQLLQSDLKFAENLHSIYWTRNIGIKKTVACLKEKWIELPFATPIKQRYIFNPVSKFWMILRHEKDKFSALNQSTGVFVFDTWLYNFKVETKDIDCNVVLQYHDEMLVVCHKEDKEVVEKALLSAMAKTNKMLNLNVEISISIDWGKNYAECH